MFCKSRYTQSRWLWNDVIKILKTSKIRQKYVVCRHCFPVSAKKNLIYHINIYLSMPSREVHWFLDILISLGNWSDLYSTRTNCSLMFCCSINVICSNGVNCQSKDNVFRDNDLQWKKIWKYQNGAVTTEWLRRI